MWTKATPGHCREPGRYFARCPATWTSFASRPNYVAHWRGSDCTRPIMTAFCAALVAGSLDGVGQLVSI